MKAEDHEYRRARIRKAINTECKEEEGHEDLDQKEECITSRT